MCVGDDVSQATESGTNVWDQGWGCWGWVFSGGSNGGDESPFDRQDSGRDAGGDGRDV